MRIATIKITLKYLCITLLVIVLGCANKNTISKISTPPQINESNVSDTLWGNVIVDPYRNLENLNDTVVNKWYKEQGIYADTLLAQISNQKALFNEIQDFEGRTLYEVSYTRQTDDDQYFYLKKHKDEPFKKLYYKKTFDSREELIYDPTSFNPKSGNNYRINYIKPSADGTHVAVSMSYKGKEVSEMIIFDMKTRKPLPQIIDHCWPASFHGIDWLPDNSGFLYLHFPYIDKTSPKFRSQSKTVLYKLGDDPKKLKIVLDAVSFPELNIDPKDYPMVKILDGNQKYLIGYAVNSQQNWDAFYALTEDLLLGNKMSWKPLFKTKDQVVKSSFAFRGNEFIYRTSKDASNYKIVTVDIEQPNFNNAKIIIEEKPDAIISDFVINSDGLYFATIKNGVEAKLFHRNNKKEKEIDLPLASGTISLSSKGIDDDDLKVYLRGWSSNYRSFQYNLSNNIFHEADLVKQADYPEFDNIVIEEVLVKSHDGAEVPLSIIYDKSLKKNSANPALFYGYGAYGVSISPFFHAPFLVWIKNGGVLCVPHIRGGGEKGNDWHKGGYKQTKSNTWKDLIACTEYMINEKYTSKQHTIIYSASAGGIMIGRAMTERPDLFAAAICKAGFLNISRIESKYGFSSSNHKEFGTVKDSIECKGLYEMDAYHHIKENTQYPATLNIIGMNDQRVPPWMSGKFIAKLQTYNTYNKPMFLKVEHDEGHGRGMSKEKGFEEWASTLAFAFWQTRHPDYQLKN